MDGDIRNRDVNKLSRYFHNIWRGPWPWPLGLLLVKRAYFYVKALCAFNKMVTCRLPEYYKNFRENWLTALIRTLVSVTKEGDFVRSGPEIADEVS